MCVRVETEVEEEEFGPTFTKDPLQEEVVSEHEIRVLRRVEGPETFILGRREFPRTTKSRLKEYFSERTSLRPHLSSSTPRLQT